ncbi:MAG: AAA family ATPase [Gallionella sp.]|nr:AAA family ATPase [Gallionella sp.]
MTALHFDQAIDKAIELLKKHSNLLPPSKTIIIRDLYGRLRLAFEGDEPERITRKLKPLLIDWLKELAPYAPATEKSAVFWKQDLLDPDAVFNSSTQREISTSPLLYLLDRQGSGLDWQRQPENEFTIPVIAFYGLKGGVGRSTALSALAYSLGEQGKRVLLLDLDLESPGISETLLPASTRSDYGIVDWLVEDAVGNANNALIREMSIASPISNVGEVRVVPAYGTKTKFYLPKLSRAYLDTQTPAGAEHFGNRLRRLTEQLIEEYQPDVILIDSRAGLHDIAAAVITHLANTALLFATDSRQTWAGYRLLFDHWQSLPLASLQAIRAKLQVVASMIPEEGGENYFETLLERSWNTFLETIYDQIEPEANGAELFSFNKNDDVGPHYPIRIYRHRAYMEFDPIADSSLLRSEKLPQAFGEFVAQVTRIAGIKHDN